MALLRLLAAVLVVVLLRYLPPRGDAPATAQPSPSTTDPDQSSTPIEQQQQNRNDSNR